MTVRADTEAAAPVRVEPRPRLAGLDRLRGLAILLMVAQHASVLAVGWHSWEATIGRATAPVFFLVGGALVSRWTTRHWHVAGIGLGVSVVIPWAGQPSALLLYAAGAALLVATRTRSTLRWVLIAVPLVLYANGIGETPGGYYTPLAVFGLMAVGALIGKQSLSRLGGPLPGWLAPVGRHPLAWYTGHLLVLQVAVWVLTGTWAGADVTRTGVL